MNEQQTQILLGGMIKLMYKMASVMADLEARIKDYEEDESAENLATFELIPLIEAMSAQLDAAYPVQPTV